MSTNARLPVRPPRRQPQQHTNSKGLIPAAARASTGEALSPAELDANLTAIETFTVAVGGRQQLLDTLAVAEAAPECEKVVNLLLDPRYGTWSLRRLCGIAGITVADLFAAYKKAMIVKAHIEATAIIARQLPPVVADVMARAVATTSVVCDLCKGRAKKKDAPPCPRCHGTFLIEREPDLDRQKVALELGQLVQQRGGLSIIQQNLSAASASASLSSGPLEQLQQAVGDLLFAPGRQRDVPGDPPTGGV